MPRWNTVTIIAGVNFSDCRALILDGPQFASAYRGSTATSADGTPHVQRVNKGVKGNKFGVSMAYALASTIASARAAIQTAEGLQQAFRVQMTSALYTIDVWAFLDYDQQPWAEGNESEGIIENVVVRFVALSVYS